ncbi:hypothetical protein CSOJ01_13976 [Colletotrichum sojae]|uniref:Uncharacterized protein n=1 Tax=Colletotrichum sojae TaxID=2175907 RepID=A0A8H6MJW3_9PEZI|nr:hypothetical protein CSOJ01_13976 [Colletotrichum sojae]
MGNSAEAPMSTNDAGLPQLPAYSPRDVDEGTRGSAAGIRGTIASDFLMSSSASLYRPIPPLMNAYYPFKITRTCHLGDSSNHKLYAVSTYAGMDNKGPGGPCVVLCNGPSEQDPPLAVAGEAENWNPQSTTSVITLPPLSLGAETSQEWTTSSVREIMRAQLTDDRRVASFRFSIEVDQTNGGYQREEFEWRKRSKDQLYGFKNGFELVRCTSGPQDVVAVIGFKGMVSFSKPFKIEFVGSGVTGNFGDRWSIMVIITALRLWVLGLQDRAG